MMSEVLRKYSIVSLVVFSLFFAGCPARKADPNFGILTFIMGDVKINNAVVETGVKVQKNDTLSTSENSLAVLQFSESAVITIKGGATLMLDDIAIRENESDILRLTQNSGSTYNKIVKKGTDYQIKTPTAVAGIRGTSFEFTISGKVNTLLLLTGKVTITPLKKGEMDREKSVLIDDGKKIQISEGPVEKPVNITEDESDELKKFEKVNMVEGLDKILLEGEKNMAAAREKMSLLAVPPDVKADILKKKEKKKEEKKWVEEKPRMSISDLQKKHGSLTVVKTKDGREYIGSFSQNDKIIEIITVTGVVKVISDNIKSITKYKQ